MSKGSIIRVLVGAAALLGGTAVRAQETQWLIKWQGTDRPGPENLPFTAGWPADPAGFEQHDPNGCYDAPGPDYAEGADVGIGGYFGIQNLPGTCQNIGHVDGGACNSGALQQTRTSPCGMRYQVGPRTVLNFFNPYNSEIMAYHGPNNRDTHLNGLTAEVSFYVAASPVFVWTNLIEIEGYPNYDNHWNDGVGSYSDNHHATVRLQHFLAGHPDNEWHLVAHADNTFDLGNISDFMNRWVTVRLALAHAPGKPQMIVWVDGIFYHAGGWDALGQGDDNDDSPHGYCRFGYSSTDGDVRIGTMAYTNTGIYSPLPRGECVNVFGDKYLFPLPPVAKTPVNPEIPGNNIDDDGDGLVDCADPDLFQDPACHNLLINGSFEQLANACQVASADCATFDPKPTGWQSSGLGTVVCQNAIWVPTPHSTEGPTWAGVASQNGDSTVWQTVRVVPHTAVSFQGDIAPGHSDGMSVQHFVELVDGDSTSQTVIQRYQTTDGNPDFRHVSLSGTCDSGLVTVRWGYHTLSGFAFIATHADNFYLTGTAIRAGNCNDPFADMDGDGDVDQDDFGILQKCFTGAGGALASGCECLDVQGEGNAPDGDVDILDLTVFEACAATSGPDIPADKTCDDSVTTLPFQITKVASRRTHGTAGDFDIDFMTSGVTESRQDGPKKIVVHFSADVQAVNGTYELGDEVTVTGGTASNLQATCNELTFDLADVADQSCLTVTLKGIALISDVHKVMPERTYKLAVLYGDADSNGVVNSADQTLTAGHLGATTASNFRMDYDADGDVDALDTLVPQYLANGHSASCP